MIVQTYKMYKREVSTVLKQPASLEVQIDDTRRFSEARNFLSIQKSTVL